MSTDKKTGLTCLLGTFMVCIIGALQLKLEADYGAFSPALFPGIAAFCMGLASLLLAVFGEQSGTHLASEEERGEGLQGLRVREIAIVAIATGLSIAYIFMLSYWGYAVATVVSTSILMIVLGERHILKAVAISTLVTLCIILFFQTFLQIPLPQGSLLGLPW